MARRDQTGPVNIWGQNIQFPKQEQGDKTGLSDQERAIPFSFTPPTSGTPHMLFLAQMLLSHLNDYLPLARRHIPHVSQLQLGGHLPDGLRPPLAHRPRRTGSLALLSHHPCHAYLMAKPDKHSFNESLMNSD